MNVRMLKVLIADDERMARRRLMRLLSSIPHVEVVAECANGEQVLQQLDNVEVDVAVLDIQMPGMSGLDVSSAAIEWGVEVVFATAHPEHAVEAFDTGAIDYVLKPIEADRLTRAMERARTRVVTRSVGGARAAGSSDRIAFASRGEVRLVDPSDISHAILDGELVSVWVGDEQIYTEISLQELERKLPEQFDRVHRRALVNFAWVDRLKPLSTGGYLAVTRTGKEVPVSRQAARQLRKRLGLA